MTAVGARTVFAVSCACLDLEFAGKSDMDVALCLSVPQVQGERAVMDRLGKKTEQQKVEFELLKMKAENKKLELAELKMKGENKSLELAELKMKAENKNLELAELKLKTDAAIAGFAASTAASAAARDAGRAAGDEGLAAAAGDLRGVVVGVDLGLHDDSCLSCRVAALA